MTTALRWAEFVLEWTVKLLPSAALFSMFFFAPDGMGWLGVTGFIPLLMIRAGCTSCMMRHCDIDPAKRGLPNLPGH